MSVQSIAVFNFAKRQLVPMSAPIFTREVCHMHIYIHIGLLCSLQNATNYRIIQIHAVKLQKYVKKMLIHVFKQKSLEEVSRIAPNYQREFVTLRSKSLRQYE